MLAPLNKGLGRLYLGPNPRSAGAKCKAPNPPSPHPSPGLLPLPIFDTQISQRATLNKGPLLQLWPPGPPRSDWLESSGNWRRRATVVDWSLPSPRQSCRAFICTGSRFISPPFLLHCRTPPGLWTQPGGINFFMTSGNTWRLSKVQELRAAGWERKYGRQGRRAVGCKVQVPFWTGCSEKRRIAWILIDCQSEMECGKEQTEKVLNKANYLILYLSTGVSWVVISIISRSSNCHNHFSWLEKYFPMQLWFIQMARFCDFLVFSNLHVLVECL